MTENYVLNKHHVDATLSILEEICSSPEVLALLAKTFPLKALALSGHLGAIDTAVKKQREL